MMRIASLKYRRAPAGGRGVNGRWHETFGRRMTSSAEGKCRNSARKTAEKQPKMWCFSWLPTCNRKFSAG